MGANAAKPFEVAVRAVLGVAVALSLAIAGPGNSGAFARALSYGARILDHGQFGASLGPEVFGGVGSAAGAFGWFSAVVLTLAYRASGIAGAYVLTALCAGAAVSLVAASARGVASGGLAAGVAGLAFIGAFGELREGASALGWCAAAFFVYASVRLGEERDAGQGRRLLLAGFLAAVIWCNASAFGTAAVALALFDALGRTFAFGANSVRAKRAWMLCGLALVATLLTPALLEYSVQSWYALDLLRDWPGGLAVHPVDVDATGYRYGIIPLALALACFSARGGGASDGFRVAGTFLLAIDNGALMPLFAFVSAPVLAGALMRAFPPREAGPVAPGARANALRYTPWFAGALATMALCATNRESGALASAQAVRDADVYRATLAGGTTHRIVCERVERCADIVALGEPNLRVLADDRALAAPPSVQKLQSDFTALSEPWLGALPGTVDVLVVEARAHSDVLLALEPGWTRAAGDKAIAIYRRGLPRARAR